MIEEAAGPDADEVKRAWNEAEHHLEVARRLGEEVPSRDAILVTPGGMVGPASGLPQAAPSRRQARSPGRVLPAGKGRPGPQSSSRAAVGPAAHADPLRQRGADGAARRAPRRRWPACRTGRPSPSARSTAGSSCPPCGCSPITRSFAARAGSGARAGTARPPRRRRPARSPKAITSSISTTASASTGASTRSPPASPRWRWRSSSTRAATGSTFPCTGSISSSGTAPPEKTATVRRRGSTGSADRAGSGCARRPAWPSGRWPASCSTCTRGGR